MYVNKELYRKVDSFSHFSLESFLPSADINSEMASLRSRRPRLAMATSWFSNLLFLLCLMFAESALAAREMSTEDLMMEGTRGRASHRPTDTELSALQDRLGYKFKDNKLLIDALTHSSFSEANNAVLHFLGSKSVQQAIALHMILQHPDISKSDLDGFVKKHANTSACAEDALELQLDSLVMVGKAVETVNSRILSAAFNAIFGAITVDDGPTTANFAYWKAKKWDDHPVDTI